MVRISAIYFGPKNEEATKSYLAAQKNLADGKEDLALGGKSVANPGFLGTYEEYGSTKAGNFLLTTLVL
jgi:hypothetical protein